MKAKTIKSVLQKKHNEFVDSIKDEEVKNLVKKNSIITGGSIVSMLLNEEVNDFDYYFTTKETALKVAEYFVEEFNKAKGFDARVSGEGDRVRVIVQSSGIAGEPEEYETDDEEIYEPATLFEDDSSHVDELKQQEEPKYKPVFLSTNAISLTGKIQLVMRFYGDAEKIHSNYDFVHATCFWRSEDNYLSLPREALEAIITKELIYTGSKYPLCSIFRTKKFINRGWQINAGQYLKMVLQLNEMNLLDMKVLEEQLTGVDSAYFAQVISYVKSKQEENPSFKLDNSYLFEVINRIF
ncbi:hypothetical protein IKI_04431 [Bacillus toyonensis]|uniref:hypothetical protein n=1 Tax=Bacillus toyonensis TaxID=155322 RepID=UPI00032E6D4C|nr:hypothetical protein [Bacillus toyonensis]EOP36334.1 hypothetical protein IKI_04431 [Bacillus toyonensis]